MPDSITITPLQPFRAALTPPGSKSLTNRALLLAALASGESEIRGVLFSDDTRVMLGALPHLGVSLEVDEPARTVRIGGAAGRWRARAKSAGDAVCLHLGNAGTAFRFLTAACCLPAPGHPIVELDGVARMRQRPIGPLVDALRQLGADVRTPQREGFPPVHAVAAGIPGGRATMDPSTSSQFVSAIAQVAPATEQGVTLAFNAPVVSRPYIEMTLALMRRFGVEAVSDAAMTELVVQPQTYEGCRYQVEPDASNASYFLAAAAVLPGSVCTIEGLGKASMQGDVGFADVLAKMGAGLAFGDDFVTVIGPPAGEALRGVDVDLNAMPDMAQTLAVVALFAHGPTVIRNIGNLRVKETDRLAALSCELTKLGARVEIDGDDLHITPPPEGVEGRLTPASIATYDDHRMAMSFAVAGLRAEGVRIEDPACVNKTYPGYFDDLARLTAQPA